MWMFWLIVALLAAWGVLGLLFPPPRCPHCQEVLVAGVYCSCTGGMEQYTQEEGGGLL